MDSTKNGFSTSKLQILSDLPLVHRQLERFDRNFKRHQNLIMLTKIVKSKNEIKHFVL